MFRQDLGYAVRLHRKHPLVTLTVVATLALGIGANTAIFSLVNGVLLRPLDYPDSERLVRLYQTYDLLKSSPNERLQAIWNRLPTSYLNALDWREESRTLEAIGLYAESTVTFLSGEEPEELDVVAADEDLFRVLGVRPVWGRFFLPEEIAQHERRVILSYELWQEVYGKAPDVLDRDVSINGEPHAIVGVMPAGFHIVGGERERVWIPLRLEDRDLQSRDHQRLHAIARLAPEASFEEAREEIVHLARGQAEAHADTNEGIGARLQPLLDSVVEKSGPVLALLTAAVIVVLLIACTNVAHLLLSQVGGRRGELAVRLALGASRLRLAGQLFQEALVLAVLGGAGGLLLAAWGQRWLLASIPADLPRSEEVTIDARVLFFTLGASLAAALLFGLLPALATSGSASMRYLRSGDGGGLHRSFDAHSGLVVMEIALTLMLSVGAAVLVSSFLKLSAVDPGFRSESLLAQEVRLPPWSYVEESRRQHFAARFLEKAEALPGVRSVALTSKLPFAGLALVGGFRIPGVDPEDQDWTQGRSASLKFVTPSYFETMGIALVRGRGFTAGDRPERGRVVVINETLARRNWPGEDPVGRSVLLSSGEEPHTVVGVVEDIRHDGLAAEPGALMYQPWSQRHGYGTDRMTAVLLAARDPLDHAVAVRRVLRELDPALPLVAATTLERLLFESVATPRARTTLVTLLASVALLLALVGTYAVMSYTVSRRLRDIGIRMVLGANATRVQAQVLRRLFALTATGLVLGALGTHLGSSLLEGLLYGVEATDPEALGISAALLGLTALVAGVGPAWRASRIDPVLVLRDE